MADFLYAISAQRKKNATQINSVLIGILVFQTLFNAFSPYLTVSINFTILAWLLIRHQPRYIKSQPLVIVTVSVYSVLIWFFLVTIYRGGAETQILLKYFRVTVNVSLFLLIFASNRIDIKSLIRAINFALGFHVCMVILQIAIPEITEVTAPVFGFEREITILEQYTMRKLGASSSYDTASQLSVAALLFFYLQYAQNKGSVYLLMATVAFVASLMSSRTGILLSLLMVTALGLLAVLRARALIWRIVAYLSLTGFLVSAYIVISPLVLHSLGFEEHQSSDTSLVYAASDYGTTGTVDALTGDHLKPLAQPLLDLFIGFAVDPNSVYMHTDIGYVKLIYNVGIVGTLIILFVHIYMLLIAGKFMRVQILDIDCTLIAKFLFIFIALSLAFNYKALVIHSRGTGDFTYMLFIFLATWRARPIRKAIPSHF